MLPVEEAMKPLLTEESFPVVLLLVVMLPLVLEFVVPVARLALVSILNLLPSWKKNRLNLSIEEFYEERV
jgi:hypothetical protein